MLTVWSQNFMEYTKNNSEFRSIKIFCQKFSGRVLGSNLENGRCKKILFKIFYLKITACVPLAYT